MMLEKGAAVMVAPFQYIKQILPWLIGKFRSV